MQEGGRERARIQTFLSPEPESTTLSCLSKNSKLEPADRILQAGGTAGAEARGEDEEEE